MLTWLRFAWERWRYPPRPMTGLWATLSPEQQAAILRRRETPHPL